MRTNMQILDFDTRDKGKCFRTTKDEANQSVPRAGLLVFDGQPVNASPCLASPRLASPLDHRPFISGNRNDTGDQARKSKLRTDPWNRGRGIADIVKASAVRPANHVVASTAELSSD